jgi:hypothetical protein
VRFVNRAKKYDFMSEQAAVIETVIRMCPPGPGNGLSRSTAQREAQAVEDMKERSALPSDSLMTA